MNNERFSSKSRSSSIVVNMKFDKIRRRFRCRDKYRIDKNRFRFRFHLRTQKINHVEKKIRQNELECRRRSYHHD